MKKAVIIGLVVVIVVAVIVVPIVVFSGKTNYDTSCYPEFDGQETCYATSKNSWNRWYGPKTDYLVSTGLSSSNATEWVIPGCKPVMLYLFSRHSARYPDIADLRKMSDYLHIFRNSILESADKGKVKLCKKDIKNLRDWEPQYHFSDAAQAMHQGEVDVHQIADRYKKMFPTLLTSEYSPEFYKFGISNRERTNQSLQAFIERVFAVEEMSKVQYPHADVVTVSFHKNCERKLWPNKTKPSRELFSEPEAFRKSLFAKRYVENIKARLGFDAKDEYTYSELRQIAIECAVSYTAYRDSPWCGVLSSDDIKVMEYDDDIYDFYKDSYGRPLNPKMGCPVVNEIVDLFNGVKEKPTETHLKSVLYFSHSRDYKKLLGSFDLFRDEQPLTAEAYCSDHVQKRKWRDATMSPYSANIGFVLFECNGTYKVLTLLNEKPIQLPRCSYAKDDYLCDLREFTSKYRFKNCNIEKICTPKAIKEQWPDSHWEDL